MNSRERISAVLNHEPADKVAVDLGGMACSGAHVSVVSKLRDILGLNKGRLHRVKVWDPYQMLGEIELDLIEALQLDIVLVPGLKNIFGFENKDWKPWKLFDGTEVLVPGKFNTQSENNGDIFQYPQGDRSAPPSGRMPCGGYYFDTIIRQSPIEESQLDPKDNLEEFKLISDEDLKYLEKQVDYYYRNTDLAIAIGIPGAAFGDIALVPAPFLKYPKGIRDIEEWYISTITRKNYIKDVFLGQCEIALENIKKIFQALGSKVQIVTMDATDLASQDSLFCSPENYKEMYLPFAKKLNDWIHEHTKWKTVKHCCGACEPLIGCFIEAGYDILNPIQCSAKGMDPKMLIEKYGREIVFWGGGVDTQKTLAFGTPDEVKDEVTRRADIFNKENGFIFNTIHNIQSGTPIENIIAMFKAIWQFNSNFFKKV